jgi:hypothetical protein
MDDKLFEEMLHEIDAMTNEEYWALYRDAQKLPDFPPVNAVYSVIANTEITIPPIIWTLTQTTISYSVLSKSEFSVFQFAAKYSDSEDSLCLTAA